MCDDELKALFKDVTAASQHILACSCMFIICTFRSCNAKLLLCGVSRYGYERELMTLLNQLCRDMNRKIERQKERAIIESSARPLNAEDKARLDAIKVSCLSLLHIKG